MAYFSPILAAQLVGLAIAGVSVTLPTQLRDAGLPSSLFAELDTTQPKPALSVTATPTQTGWRLDFETENWIFSDLCGRTDQPTAEGHAHIYLGDEKIGMATLPFFYLDALPYGSNAPITVSLRGPDHRVVVYDGEVISAEITLPAGPV
ncbi:hypothetical protein [Yoonia sp. BS5-3]|uniref:Secreted protein n=1 Tax=Yoonia phaeophyticola TaxID=3137369 RepID=A0ABZ2V591_9RHOB